MARVLAILSGTHGITSAVQDESHPKTVKVSYHPAIVSDNDIVTIINRADIRLQSHHWLYRWFPWAAWRPKSKRTARILNN
jgi:hypothetical protein